MGRLSNISGKQTVKIFEKFGYDVDHQTGSHIILWHESKPILIDSLILYYMINLF